MSNVGVGSVWRWYPHTILNPLVEPTGVDKKTAKKPDSQILILALLLEVGLILNIWLLQKAARPSTDITLPYKAYVMKG